MCSREQLEVKFQMMVVIYNLDAQRRVTQPLPASLDASIAKRV